ncbi:MAG: hypothetical protein NT095_09185 [Burkholderiales bacterium]|nr:hypothetical protein [Burkholderiales bacterium]
MKLEDDDLKSLIRSAKSPGLSKNFLSSTLDKAGFSATPLAAVHTTANGHKLFSVFQLFTHRYSSLFLIIAIAGMLLLKTSMHAEEEELHHIDTLSLSTLLVL